MAAAVELCKAGPITSGMLAQAMGCGGETARGDLVALARAGTLEATGERGTRCYRLAGEMKV
jgi:predicted ArsR family transcriptional regulator